MGTSSRRHCYVEVHQGLSDRARRDRSGDTFSEDKLVHVIKKCRLYERIGTERIFVLDPIEKFAWQWKSGSLEAITQLLLPNGAAVALEEIWRQLEEQA